MTRPYIRLGDLVQCDEYVDYGDVVEIKLERDDEYVYLVRDVAHPHNCFWIDETHVHRLEGKRHDPSLG